jgi:anaerobic selenocysteine-containing dehydrogenase
VAPRCGIAADTIRRLARELAAAPRAAVYARIGTCTQEYGTLCSWLVDVLNTLTATWTAKAARCSPNPPRLPATPPANPASAKA